MIETRPCSSVACSVAPGAARVTLSFSEGATFISPRMFLIRVITSITIPISRSASGSAQASSASGKGLTMTELPSATRVCQISSVRKGMKGWRSLSDCVRTVRRVFCAARLAGAFFSP